MHILQKQERYQLQGIQLFVTPLISTPNPATGPLHLHQFVMYVKKCLPECAKGFLPDKCGFFQTEVSPPAALPLLCLSAVPRLSPLSLS